jgi:hypothetical protein
MADAVDKKSDVAPKPGRNSTVSHHDMVGRESGGMRGEARPAFWVEQAYHNMVWKTAQNFVDQRKSSLGITISINADMLRAETTRAAVEWEIVSF